MSGGLSLMLLPFLVDCSQTSQLAGRITVGALIIRIGFRAPLYYNDNKEPPK